MIYVAGMNQPGYMPDCEPAEFEDFDSAKRYVISLVKNSEDCAQDDDEAENLSAFAEHVNLQSREFSATCCRWVYWVSEQ